MRITSFRYIVYRKVFSIYMLNVCLYSEFLLVHFVELSILSPQKCNFVLSVMLQSKKKLKKINTLRKIAFTFRHFTIFLLRDMISL